MVHSIFKLLTHSLYYPLCPGGGAAPAAAGAPAAAAAPAKAAAPVEEEVDALDGRLYYSLRKLILLATRCFVSKDLLNSLLTLCRILV